jgi:hypothetical protein
MDISKPDLEIIKNITARAASIAQQHGHDYDLMSGTMDISSAHLDMPLRLDALLEADDFNFIHDVFGISQHLDRSKYPGKLTDCFRPRFAM